MLVQEGSVSLFYSVFMGSPDGIKMLYPWRGNYSSKIDPRKRAWYLNALDQNKPVWGKPYMDLDSVAGLSIPCSVQIQDLHGNFCGVASLDLSLNHLTHNLLKRGNVGEYVLEKAIIDTVGNVVVSSKSEYFNKTFDPDKYHQEAPFDMPKFHSKQICDRITKRGRDYNTFINIENGKQVLYAFAYLEVFKMYYVAVADYDFLLQHTETLKQKN